jgi:hypothetical protein
MRYLPFPLRLRYALVRSLHIIQPGRVHKSIIRYTTTQTPFKTCHIFFCRRDIPSSQPPTSDRYFSTIRSLTSH